MKRKNIAIATLLVSIGVIAGYLQVNKDTKEENSVTELPLVQMPESIINEDIKSILPGIKTSALSIEKDPYRVSGEFFMPKHNLEEFLKLFLKKSNNNDISNISIELKNDLIILNAKYKVLGMLNPSVSLHIQPFVNKDGNVELIIKKVEVAKLNINNKLVSSIIGSWTDNQEYISSNNKSVIIDSKLFKNIKISNISIENNELSVNLDLLI